MDELGIRSICLRRGDTSLLDIPRESKAKMCYFTSAVAWFLRAQDLRCYVPTKTLHMKKELKNSGIALIKLKFLVIVIELYR